MKISASYTLKMTYDNMYRVTGKSQHLSQTGVQFDGTLSAGYDLKYTYSSEEGKRFQLAGVDDVNYSTETVTEESKVVNAHAYEYDANGNLVFVNTSRTKKDGQTTPNAGERKLKWDEENRLTASDDNGFVTSYWYDASGERTVKSSGENAAMFVNAEFAGGMTNTAKFSLYVSPYLVANQGGRYTKHIYIGSQRIVSKLGDLKSYGADPRRIEYAGSESDGPKVDYKTKYAQQQQAIKDNFAHFDVPYNGADNNDYVDGKGFSERDGSLKSAMLKAAMAKEGNKSAGLKDNFQQGDSYEQYQYFYHPDHLGSSSFITNTEGEVVQHVEYVPYGEVFIEERNNVWNTPYLFNAKEFDEETGLYYYGARYYDSRLAIWYGVDALAEKYPNMGGYVYCAGNPVKFVDVDGREILTSFKTTISKNDNLSLVGRIMTNRVLEKGIKSKVKDHDDMIFIGAHGSPSFMTLANGKISSSSDMKNFLEQNSIVWKKNTENKCPSVIVLYSCSTGKGDNSIAQQISKDLGALVIAPDAILHYNTSDGTSQIYDNWYNKDGHWNIYYKGELKEQLNGADPWLWGEKAIQLNDFLKDKNATQLINKYSKDNKNELSE